MSDNARSGTLHCITRLLLLLQNTPQAYDYYRFTYCQYAWHRWAGTSGFYTWWAQLAPSEK